MAYDNHLYVFFFQMRFISLPNPTKTPYCPLSKLDNSVVFSIYYLHKGFGKKSCNALQSVAIDSVSLYRYE